MSVRMVRTSHLMEPAFSLKNSSSNGQGGIVRRSISVLSVLLFFTATAILKAQNATDLFQQALELERGKGDLAGAMQIYQRIVREFPSDKAVAASALFRLGYSQEKIGQAQARTSYERLVREYAD